MAVKQQQQKRHVKSKINPFYDSYWVNKFINKFMKHGRKKITENHVYKAFAQIKQVTLENPGRLLLQNIEVLRPVINAAKHIKRFGKRRRRRRIKLVPIPVNLRRQLVLALTWIVQLIRYQKRVRRAHRHNKLKEPASKVKGQKINLSKFFVRKKGNYGRSRKKLFPDRFYVTLRHQSLCELIRKKFEEIYASSFAYLIRRRDFFHDKVVQKRTFLHYRWA